MENSIICLLDEIQKDKNTVGLFFKSKIFYFSSKFPRFSNINQEIYSQLLETKQYVVKSDVSNDVFQSFIEYWTKNKIPNITTLNISEYKLLSLEFDTMKDIIQIYQKLILTDPTISSLTRKHEKNKQNLLFRRNKLKEKTDKYQKITYFLFTNTGIKTRSDFNKIKNDLQKHCDKENVKLINYFTQPFVEENGLFYLINDEEQTAGVFRCVLEKPAKVFIPKTVKHKNKEYLVTSILDESFYNQRKILTVEFPEDSEIRTICSFAFALSTVESIVIPRRVEKICKGAFYYAQKLKSVCFEENSEIKTIEDNAFYATSIEKLTIPSSITSLSNSFLGNIKELKNINVIENEIKNLTFFQRDFLLGKLDSKSNVFDVLIFCRRDIEYAFIPDFIKVIAPFAFEKCKNLCSIDFLSNSNLFLIGEKAFNESALESIRIPSSVCQIDSSAFSNCLYLSSVYIPNDTKMNSIGNDTFARCPFKNIRIPPQILSIGHGAFLECKRLKTIDIPDNSELRFISDMAFYYSSLNKLHITSKVEDIQNLSFTGNDQLTKIRLSKENESFIYYNKSMIIGKKALLSDEYDIILFIRANVRAVTVPPFINEIPSNIFDACTRIKYFVIPEESKIKKIPKNCFQMCMSLERVSISSNIIVIDDDAFYECSSLNRIDFHPNSRLRRIGRNAFSGTKLVSIKFPDHLRTIGECAFYESTLKIVEFTEKSELQSIETSAFQDNPVKYVLLPSRLRHFLCYFEVYDTNSDEWEISDE